MIGKQDFIFTSSKGIAFLIFDGEKDRNNAQNFLKEIELFGSTFQHPYFIAICHNNYDFNIFQMIQSRYEEGDIQEDQFNQFMGAGQMLGGS